MTKILLSICIFFFYDMNYSIAQTDVFFIDSLIRPFELIYVKPIKKINLERESIRDYEYFLEGSGKSKVDASVLMEIIENSNQLDTSHWKDSEIKKAILIKNRNESIDLIQVLQKFSPLKSKEQIKLKKIVTNYNKAGNSATTIPDKRIVNSFTRPIFDKSGRYAVIGYSRPREGGGITLYQLVNGRWVLIGDIERWSY